MTMAAWLGSRGWYGRRGSIEVQWPRLARFRPDLRVTRNGRCLAIDVSVGNLWASGAIYRHRFDDDG